MRRFNLHAFRLDRKLTQVELADILQCKQSFVCSLEKKKRPVPEEKIILLEEKFGDLSAYISNYIEEDSDDNATEETNEMAAYISGPSANNIGYITVPSKFLEELSKLTETIHSQQRTIEKLVNLKTLN